MYKFCFIFILHFQFIISQNIDQKIDELNRIITTTTNNDTLLSKHLEIGKIYYKKKLIFNKAINHFNKANNIALKLNAKSNIYETYLYLGFCYKKMNRKDSSFIFFNNALKYSKGELLQSSRVYSNIASLYKKDNKKKAINYYQKSIKIGEKTKRNLCTTYNNFGSLYLGINIDSAIYYFNKSLRIAIKNKDYKKNLRAQLNIGIAYLNDSIHYLKSYKYFKNCKEISKKIEEDRLLCYSNFYLAQYFDKVKEPKKAISSFNTTLNSKTINEDIPLHIEVLKEIALFYENSGNYKKANNFQKQYYHLKDSIYTLEKNKAFNDIQTKYEVEKKDNKITLLTKEKQLEKSKKNNIIIGASAVLAILLLLTYFLRNKIKTQKIVQKNKQKLFTQELKTKKALSLIEGQENERNRLAKELHDGLGGQLAGVKSIIQTISTDNIQEKTIIVNKHLSSSIKSLRNISHDLSATFLKNKDFDVLIQQLIKQSFENKTIQSEISIFPTQKINKLPERYKLNIYRVLQESFQNILKHAKANFVSVSILIDEEINILIEDNGIGFNTNIKTNGIGLQNIKDRIQSLNGTLYIDSELNKGTTLNINIPYND